MEQEAAIPSPAITRRRLMQTGAVVGGALWAAPVIESFTSTAAAQSPAHHYCDLGFPQVCVAWKTGEQYYYSCFTKDSSGTSCTTDQPAFSQDTGFICTTGVLKFKKDGSQPSFCDTSNNEQPLTPTSDCITFLNCDSGKLSPCGGAEILAGCYFDGTTWSNCSTDSSGCITPTGSPQPIGSCSHYSPGDYYTTLCEGSYALCLTGASGGAGNDGSGGKGGCGSQITGGFTVPPGETWSLCFGLGEAGQQGSSTSSGLGGWGSACSSGSYQGGEGYGTGGGGGGGSKCDALGTSFCVVAGGGGGGDGDGGDGGSGGSGPWQSSPEGQSADAPHCGGGGGGDQGGCAGQNTDPSGGGKSKTTCGSSPWTLISSSGYGQQGAHGFFTLTRS